MVELVKNELSKGLTQMGLAKKIGISQGGIQDILYSKKNFTYETRKKVADYFHIPITMLYDEPAEAQRFGKITERRDDELVMYKKICASQEDTIESQAKTIALLEKENARLSALPRPIVVSEVNESQEQHRVSM